MVRAPRLSGLQRQVLSLYRSALRISRAKEQQGSLTIAELARADIERHRAVSRKDIQLIEHLIRRGRRQLDLLGTLEVTGMQLQNRPRP
ncbi:hypothetical protein D9Q98_007947 [Chlorella vulgaris]|uniref:Complex 1 LYR protein domain-containing protein n=1 Tax=Chlorella vulgaris TaxID=3077 RepID=A0A9D4THU3_CHLVU|nr:hypothetical protein D9Q98_007947 [Chlorella vulgaris]